MSDSEAQNTILVEVYENQRRFPVTGWSETKRLPTDRPRFTDRSGQKELKIDDPRTIPHGFVTHEDYGWRTDVPPKGTDKEGWEYALDFPRAYSPNETFHTWVRRRRWVRPAFRATQDQAAAATAGVGRDANDATLSAAPPTADASASRRSVDSLDAAASPTGSTASPKAPPKKKKTAEEEMLETWDAVRGSRCGSVCLRVDNVTMHKESAMRVRIRHSAQEFNSRERTANARRHDDVNYEVCFLVADDITPIFISPVAGGHAVGEGVLSLRAASRTAETFERVVMNGVYTEIGTATLTLHPHPVESSKADRQVDILGTVHISWTFNLREANEQDFCPHCGHVPVMCTCETSCRPDEKVEQMIASMARMSSTSGSGNVAPASDPHEDKRGRLVVRVAEGESLGTASHTHLKPYLQFTFIDSHFKTSTVHTEARSGRDVCWSETLAMDIGDFSRGVRIELYDSCTFTKDRLVGTADLLTPSAVEALSVGSGIATIGFRAADSEVPVTAGVIVATITWIPFTL